MKKIFALILAVSIGGPALAGQPVAKLLNVKMISDEAPHSAFTDLVWWHDQFVCAFREGRGHVATDGRLKVMTSPDGETWKEAAVLKLDGFDLRDAGLSVTPNDRLMLIGGAAPRKSDSELVPTGSIVAFSNDGATWTKPQIVSEPGRWLWRVTWHDGKAYGVSYPADVKDNDNYSMLVASQDGVHFETVAAKMFESFDARPTEAVIRFSDDSTAYCLHRRDGSKPPKSAFVGTSKPPYTEWSWHDSKAHVGGPALLQLPNGVWLAAGRLYPKDGPKTCVAWLDTADYSLHQILVLPSGGDNSYPGLVWHSDLLWMTYYASHEGKAKIYLAKVAIK